MARPFKTGLDYFPLDVDFFVDDKLIAIAGEFGIKGEATVIHLLCAIYRNGYYVEWNERLRSKLDRELPGVSVELINMIVERLVRWGFFDKDLFCSSSILTSKGIQRRYFEAVRKRKGNISSLPYLLVTNNSKNVSEPTAPIHGITPQPMPKAQPIPQPLPQPQQVSAVIAGNSDNAKCLDRLFSEGNKANIEMLMMNLSLRPEDKDRLRSVAESVVNEWNATSTTHRDYSDWARHLISTVRIKLNEAEKDKNKKTYHTISSPSNDYQYDGGFGGQDI